MHNGNYIEGMFPSSDWLAKGEGGTKSQPDRNPPGVV